MTINDLAEITCSMNRCPIVDGCFVTTYVETIAPSETNEETT